MFKLLNELSHQLISEENLNLNWLPEEVLLHIFKFLPLDDILEVALTSQRLANIVDDNFNVLAPINHRIKLSCWNEYRDWVGRRKYSNFVIDSTGVIRFQQIVLQKSHQITKLSLNFHNDPYVDMAVVRDILMRCGNLKELRLNLTNVIATSENSLESLVNLGNLKILDFYGSSKFFNLFMNLQLKTLKLRFYDAKDCFVIFKNFLKKQTKLSELSLYGYNIPSTRPRSLFDDESLNKVNFRLKTLKISRHPKFFVGTDSFAKFLQNHQDSLTSFNISHSEVNLDIVKNFKNLTKLDIERSLLTSTDNNPHIEEVISKRSAIGFTGNLPNLKILIVIESVPYLSELNFERLTHLESLDIYATHIPRLVIPSVKNLKIFNAMSFDADAFPLFHNNVENLLLKSCENVRAILDYLNQPDAHLKTLTIQESRIESRCMKSIRKNIQKIDLVDIIRCHRIPNIPFWNQCGCEDLFSLIGMGHF